MTLRQRAFPGGARGPISALTPDTSPELLANALAALPPADDVTQLSDVPAFLTWLETGPLATNVPLDGLSAQIIRQRLADVMQRHPVDAASPIGVALLWLADYLAEPQPKPVTILSRFAAARKGPSCEIVERGVG